MGKILGDSQGGIRSCTLAVRPQNFNTSYARGASSCLQSAIDTSERLRQHDGHQHASDCSDDHLRCSTNTEVSDASQEQIGDEQVERAPQHIDQRRRFSLTWGRCEWRRKPMAGYSVNKMRHEIDEESAAEKIRHVMVPTHKLLFLGPIVVMPTSWSRRNYSLAFNLSRLLFSWTCESRASGSFIEFGIIRQRHHAQYVPGRRPIPRIFFDIQQHPTQSQHPRESGFRSL